MIYCKMYLFLLWLLWLLFCLFLFLVTTVDFLVFLIIKLCHLLTQLELSNDALYLRLVDHGHKPAVHILV